MVAPGSASAAEPPPRDEALALADELLERVREDRVQATWLEGVLEPPPYASGLQEHRVQTWASRLSPDAPVGARLSELAGPVAAVQGPQTQRVLLESPPGLSAVFVRDAAGETRLRELTWTTCSLCTERVRFVADLLDEVQRRGVQAHRLVPGLELDLDAHHEAHGERETWTAALSLRNGQGRYLPTLLHGAQVMGEHEGRVRVRYADGREDPWPVHWREGRWQVDYERLQPDSPLRLATSAASQWGKRRVLAEAARAGWHPPFRSLGPGLLLAEEALDAWPDPRDGTVLIVVRDVDRALAAIFRVDPETRTVVERLRGPSLDVRTQLPLQGWLERWPTALSPDGRRLALTGPNRLWTVDLVEGTSRTVARGDFHQLDFISRTRVWATRGQTLFELDVEAHSESRTRLPAPPVGLFRTPAGTTLIDARGLAAGPDETGEARSLSRQACCGEVLEARPNASGSATLLTCGEGCTNAAAWVNDTEVTPIPGQGGQRGASCSPDGRRHTTGHPEGVLVWHGLDDPSPTLLPAGPVRLARWSGDAEHLVTVGADGRVIWWEVGPAD